VIPRCVAHDPCALVIIDWSWLCRRAFEIAGTEKFASIVCGQLARLLSDPMPPSIALAVDPERTDPESRTVRRRWTWRDRATSHLPEEKRYKAGRPPKTPEQAHVEKRLLEVVHAMRIPILGPEDPTVEQDWEADDSAAAAVKLATSEGRSVVLYSSDKDWLQLVRSDDPTRPVVVRWVPRRDGDELYDEPAVLKRFDVTSAQMCDYLAIVGDTGDNVPGVKGVGPKGAAKILFDHGTLDKALETPPDTTAERKLRAQADEARFSRSLIRLADDVPIEWDPQEQMTGGFDVRRLAKLYHDFGFSDLARSIPSFDKQRFTM